MNGRAKRTCEICSERQPTYGLSPVIAEPGMLDGTAADDGMQVAAGFAARSAVSALEPRKHPRWCSRCAKNHHPTAVDVVHAMCETCRKARALFGLKEENRRRWCTSCAKRTQPDATGTKHTVWLAFGYVLFGVWFCAHSTLSQSQYCFIILSFIPADMSWSKKCEDCRIKRPHFGFIAEGRSRWCGTCAKTAHPGATDICTPKCEDCIIKQVWLCLHVGT
jgi:hypothetical protein